MVDNVRIGFAGLGRWSTNLAGAAAHSHRVEIAGGASLSSDKRAAFVLTFGGREFASVEELISDDRVDGIVITTPNSLHKRHVMLAAEHGKHVFVEKPMALSVADCRAMIAAAEATGVVLSVGHNTRRMARYRAAAGLVRQGALGEVILAEGNNSGPQGSQLTSQEWRWLRSESPGGPLASFTVHQADNLNYLVGPVTRVSAFISKLSGPAPPDDVMAAVLEFQAGALGYLGGTMLSGVRNFTQLHGTEGNVLIDEMGGRALYQTKRGSTFEELAMPDAPAQLASSLAEEIDEFARCIQEGETPETGGQVGMAAVAVIEAIQRSAASASAIAVADLP